MEKQEVLHWFVDFANMDLETIKPGDRAKLLIESEEYLSPEKDLGDIETPQSKKAVDWVTSWILQSSNKDTAEYWDNLKALQKVVIETLCEFFMPGDEIRFGFAWQGEMVVRAIWEKNLNLSYIPLARTHREYILLKISQLLNGFPRQSIQKCHGCEKYFLNATFRKKRFCSPKCMWRVIAGKRRKELKEKHPKKYKAYLKKQKEIMSKKFQEEQEAKGFRKVAPYKYTRIVKR